MKSGAASEKAKLIDRCGLSNMLNNVVINNFLKNFGYYTQERNRSVVSYGGLIARFVDGFYQVCTPFQGKVILLIEVRLKLDVRNAQVGKEREVQ